MPFISGKKASEILGVTRTTLYAWVEKGKLEIIRTPGGKRLYDVEKFLLETKEKKEKNKNPINEIKEERLKICYCRVSSSGQKTDLENQIEYMQKKYPKYELIKDIGSALNMNRKGLNKIIDLAIKGKIEEVVVAYKDRLARFGFEMIENIINKYSKGKITVVNETKISIEEEITRDLIQIMNVFSAKVNGLRKYKKNIKKELNIKKN